ncbi:FkbM family methyltransferase [Dyadobacter arcticus]|uniref:Methyltransferase FkbM domain-containing protein n=1 Tax=Dyadobacter arcticus TaxID=1078754 RepID=A0ABX0UHQ1_9BACT|nr:FkbM family methyltransferase [Dyadobacter arcticus]NIJ51569.1 hypothetical protein [Dyadobacter arcticus]
MINLIKRKLESLFSGYKSSLSSDLENIKVSQGLILNKLNLGNSTPLILDDITKSEFKIFSQWGDDGIISFLVSYLEIKDKRFVEFGVENYTECNTKFLLISQNWRGLIMDGSNKNMTSLRTSDLYWKFDITAVDVFVTAENIDSLLKDNGFSGEIGILHIDIDGNDYWIWKSVTVANPIIVIVEYNSIFGFEQPWTIPYNPSFVRTEEHYSNLYYGTSLLSICDLAEEKGYHFIGCNSNGNNAYFVRKDWIKGLRVVSPQDGYIESKFREARDENGTLTFVTGSERLNQLRGKKIHNTRTNSLEDI